MEDEVINPQELAYEVAVETSERKNAVGDFVGKTDLGSNVTDFRFACTMLGYEGWQWSVTLYHDEDAGRWTVNESSLAPTEDSLLPPPWVPWKDRLRPTDLSVMDSIGTAEDDSRLEDGVKLDGIQENNASEDGSQCAKDSENSNNSNNVENSENSVDVENSSDSKSAYNADNYNADNASAEDDENLENGESKEDFEDAVETFRLTRKRVMTAQAIAQTAKRWYAGQHGPKSLSTKIADGKACSSCGFMIPLAGSLGNMFGVCANMWSPDDGRVVALDHGCGEHSEIAPPEPSQLWVQSEPAYDDYHIEIVPQTPREERADVELIEEAIEDSKENRKSRRKRVLDENNQDSKEHDDDGLRNEGEDIANNNSGLQYEDVAESKSSAQIVDNAESEDNFDSNNNPQPND
ncbi:DUF3027 domain-containing protein [Gardnerella vaginalis]|uniref:DUF3027 domain-containing protein n=1 Tax=Gardnerella TaxID=2701 RepID=UPI000E218912|nr:DUF3027 domain-containing protein [Gardnerella vaginalis]RDW95816.1 hypothetical protein gvb04_04250 [Gardnerella vaginalis]